MTAGVSTTATAGVSATATAGAEVSAGAETDSAEGSADESKRDGNVLGSTKVVKETSQRGACSLSGPAAARGVAANALQERPAAGADRADRNQWMNDSLPVNRRAPGGIPVL